MNYDIQLKRIYQEICDDDGARILVDRLWPRGKHRELLALTEWYRGASPSSVLRRQYHNNIISKAVFESRYRGELRDDSESLIPLMRYARQGRLTLLSASRELSTSHLPLLKDALICALQEEDNADRKLSPPPTMPS
ncbi:DUF488 domain-containing protein [Halomonas halocynthiae]|uniref:DUF488 domain-containing protein n=1 Tax=Halomonas halocynthiae TaxID=176290 RepID=UPI000405E986|nr:DUF488 family protein [Halomonas halocynthiae]